MRPDRLVARESAFGLKVIGGCTNHGGERQLQAFHLFALVWETLAKAQSIGIAAGADPL
jgi:hypothetical protein